MADERSKMEDKNTNKSSMEVANNREEWVSFEEESEVPLLPQPPSRVNDINSERYINRLEQKLHQMKGPSKVTSKIIVSALTETREGQMNTIMSEPSGIWNMSDQTDNNMNWNESIRESKCCCVSCYSYIFPKQAKTTQEIECLLDEDELAIVNSEQTENEPVPG